LFEDKLSFIANLIYTAALYFYSFIIHDRNQLKHFAFYKQEVLPLIDTFLND